MNRYLASSLLALCVAPAFAWQGKVEVSTPHTTMLLQANEGEDLRMAYYGAKVSNPWQVSEAGDDLNFSAMPAFGTVDMIHLPALQIKHANGDINLELAVDAVETHDEAGARVTVITMKDKLQPITVKLCYKAYTTVDVIETWTEITNREKRAITLKRYDSGQITLRQRQCVAHTHARQLGR